MYLNALLKYSEPLTRRRTNRNISRRRTSVQICTVGDYRRLSLLNLKNFNGFIQIELFKMTVLHS